MGTDLSEISNRIASLISDPSARVSVVVETGYDEAGLVAARDGYLQFAQALIDFVRQADAGEADVVKIGDVVLATAATLGNIFEPGEVALDSASMALTEEEAKQAADYFRRLSPQATPH